MSVLERCRHMIAVYRIEEGYSEHLREPILSRPMEKEINRIQPRHLIC